jgi:hypothetical protein
MIEIEARTVQAYIINGPRLGRPQSQDEYRQLGNEIAMAFNEAAEAVDDPKLRPNEICHFTLQMASEGDLIIPGPIKMVCDNTDIGLVKKLLEPILEQ